MMQSIFTKEEKRLFLRCLYQYSIVGAVSLMVGSLLPYIRETWGLGYQVSGLLVSAHSVGNLVSGFLVGLLCMRLGKKLCTLFSVLCGLAAFILMIFTGNPFLMIFAFALTGVMRGGVNYYNNTTVNEIATGKAWALNILHASYSVGAFLAPFLVLFCVRKDSSHWIWAAVIMIVLISTVVVLCLLSPSDRPVLGKQMPKTRDFSFLKNRRYLLDCSILFTYLAAEQAINGWLVTYLKDSGIMKVSFAQVMASILWIVMLIGRLLTAWISRYVHKDILLFGTTVGYLIFFILLVFGRSSTTAMVGVIGTGLFMSGIYPTNLASIGHVMAKYPLALNFYVTIGALGAIIMPTIIGLVAGKVGILGGMSVMTVAVVLSFVLIFINMITSPKKED